MNRLILSIVLLAAMAAGCFYSVYLTTQRTDELSGLIDQVEQAHSDGDDKSALEYAEQLHSSWDSILHYSILVNDLGRNGDNILHCRDSFICGGGRRRTLRRLRPRTGSAGIIQGNADAHALEDTLR